MLTIQEGFMASQGPWSHHCFRLEFQVNRRLLIFEDFLYLLIHFYLSLLGGQAFQDPQHSGYLLYFLSGMDHFPQALLPH